MIELNFLMLTWWVLIPLFGMGVVYLTMHHKGKKRGA